MPRNRPIQYQVGGWNTKHVFEYKKRREQYKLSPQGRWGPAWLHRSVFWVAKNLGMVGHRIEVKDIPMTTFSTVSSDDPSMVRNVEAALLNYEGLDIRDPPAVYVGPDVFRDLLHDIGSSGIHMGADISLHARLPDGRQLDLWGVPVFVTPCISGVVVVPYPEKQHSGPSEDEMFSPDDMLDRDPYGTGGYR